MIILEKMMLLMSLFIEATCSAGNQESAQQRLVTTLLTGYDKDLRPVWNTRSTTNVTTNPALHSIAATDEASESITIVLWFRMLWNDVFLQWNPDDYDGMVQLLLPIDRIWYPDLSIHNMIDVRLLMPNEKNYAIIDYQGNVLISIDKLVTFSCMYEHMRGFCRGYYATRQPLKIPILTYPRLIWLIVVSSFIITTLAIVGIFGPFNDAGDREEKVTMGLTTLLTMAVVLLLVTGQMPKGSSPMPLLALYIILEIAISAFASITAAYVMYQHSKWTRGLPVSKWIIAVTLLHYDSPDHEKFNAICFTNIALATLMVKHDTITGDGNETPQARDDTSSIIDQLIVNNLRSTLTPVNIALEKSDHREALRLKWTRATRRLDLIFMFLFNLLHVVLTVAILVYGFSRIRQFADMPKL